jgi:hypothetical protein
MPALVARLHMTTQGRRASTCQIPQNAVLPSRCDIAIGVEIRGAITSDHVRNFQQGSDHDPPPSSGAGDDEFSLGGAGTAGELSLARVVLDSNRSRGLHVEVIDSIDTCR